MVKFPILGYGRQKIDQADIDAVVDVLQSELLTQGPAVERFENAFAERVGARHAVAVSNGTAALHLACLAAGLGKGDTVALPSLTFVATANAPTYCGARAALLDINADSRCMTGDDLRAHVQEDPATAAVMPVHFGGATADMRDIRDAAGSRVIIEDACHALGGVYSDGHPVGSCRFGDMAAFSFHPVKPITTGEGGAITTNEDDLAERLRIFRNHGIERSPEKFTDRDAAATAPWWYEQQELGFNYRMTDIQAALGLSQLRRLDDFLARRREIAAMYDAAFLGLTSARPAQASADARRRSGLHLYQLDIDFDGAGISRQDLMARLLKVGIGTQVHYIPVHRQPFHRDAANGKLFPETDRHYDRTLSIPLSAAMTDEDAEHVVRAFRSFLN